MARSSTVLPPPYTTVASDAARFLYGWPRERLLCYPPLHYCWGRYCPFFIRLAVRSSTVLPPPTLLLGQMLPFFYTVGCWATLHCATPLHYTLVKCCLFWCDERWRVGRLVTVLLPCAAHRINAACFDAMHVGVLVQPYIVLPQSRGKFCPSWPHSLLTHIMFHYSQWGLHNKTSTFVAPSRVALVPPPPAPPTTSTMPTGDDAGYLGRLRPSTRPNQEATRKEGNARGPATRDGEDNVTRTSTTSATPTRANSKALRPPGSTRRSTRRRRKIPYRARGHIDAKYRQPRGSASSGPPRTQQSTTADPWLLRARQSASLRASGTNTPMPAPRTQSLKFLGPKEHSTKPTRPCTGVRNADGKMTNVDAARIKPSTRQGPLLARRPAR